MEQLKKPSTDKDKKRDTNKQQFSQWNKCLQASKVSKLEDLYKKIHAEIRKNPDRVKSARPKAKRLNREERLKLRDTTNVLTGIGGKKYRRDRKITLASRKKRVVEKIQAWAKARQQKGK